MLVDEKPYQLTGYLSANEQGAAFVIPIFSSQNSNMMFVQEISDSGCIVRFNPTDSNQIYVVNENIKDFTIGDQAFWGFKNADGRLVFANRDEMRELLFPIIDTFEEPLLRLQIAQFCEMIDEIIKNWSNEFHYIKNSSPKSAEAWRDIVIVPSEMRRAVKRVIDSIGLGSRLENLDKLVDVSVRNGIIYIQLDRELYSPIVNNREAVRLIEENAMPIRQAFQLPLSSVEIESKVLSSDTKSANKNVLEDIAIAGFGDMALSLITGVFPKQNHAVLSLLDSFADYRDGHKAVLLQNGGFEDDADWGASELHPMVNENCKVVLVVFQLDAKYKDLIDRAINFARKNHNKDRPMIAVIPHLLHEFGASDNLSRSVIPNLREYFDAVWVLSDRSPYTRQAIQFGPARSVGAVCKHFQHLIDLTGSQDIHDQLIGDRDVINNINLIGSSVGSRSVPNLAEHAMLRLRHNLFDFINVTNINITSSSPEYMLHDIISGAVNIESPNAKVVLQQAPRFSASQNQVLLIVKDVSVIEGGADRFEKYCAYNLMRFGWEFNISKDKNRANISSSKMGAISISFKYTRARRLSYKSDSPKLWNVKYDTILFTNASISGRVFAEYVLNGQVPIHHSRLDAIGRIYSKRYIYAISYVDKEQSIGWKIVRQVAIEWFMNRHMGEIQRSYKFDVATLSDITYVLKSDLIQISISVKLKYSGEKDVGDTYGTANVVLDAQGWKMIKFQLHN